MPAHKHSQTDTHTHTGCEGERRNRLEVMEMGNNAAFHRGGKNEEENHGGTASHTRGGARARGPGLRVRTRADGFGSDKSAVTLTRSRLKRKSGEDGRRRGGGEEDKWERVGWQARLGGWAGQLDGAEGHSGWEFC